MALKAQQAMGSEQVTALADRGYFNGDQVLSCEGTGVAPIVPKTLTSSGAKRGFFTRQDFIYNAEHDHYTCPAGAKLTKIHRRVDHTEDFDRYRHLSACFTCPLRPGARRPRGGSSSAGRMKTCSTGCRIGSTACPRPWACDDSRSNTRSGPSRPGWAPPTS